MKIKILFAILLISFFSCNDVELINESIENKLETNTRSAGDGIYDLLGYGYNCFYSDLKDPLYARARVIDLERLEKGLGRDPITGQEISFSPAKIETSLLHGKTETETVYGSSVHTLTENINIHATANVGTKILKLFSLDLEATINSGETTEDRNAFYRVNSTKMTRRLTLPYSSPSRLKYFFTDEFLSDLKNLSGLNLVEKYGTHVMTDILLGGNFSALYTAKYTSNEETQMQEFKVSSNFLMSSITANTHYDRTLFNSFKNVHIYIKTQGGSQAVTAIISQDPNGKLDNVSFDYASWMSSVTTEAETLIGIGNPDTRIYLLSEFIDDPGKKKEIELALEAKEVNYEIVGTLASSKKTVYQNSLQMNLLYNSLSSKVNIIPIGLANSIIALRNGCAVTLEFEDDYVKFKTFGKYLDNTLWYRTDQHNKSQQWKMEYINDKYFTLKNLENNQYLSSHDLKFYNIRNSNDSTLYWSLLPNFAAIK